MKKIFSFLKSRTFLINLGIALIALPLLYWIIFSWLSHYTRHNDFVTVPDFRKLHLVELDAFVKDKNIGYEVIDSTWDPTVPKGIVIRQDPDPGDSVKEGRKVYLYVSSLIPPTVKMPDLTNLSLRQALAVCQSYGLRVDPKATDSPFKDNIIKQMYNNKIIAPGTDIQKGERVTLYYGKGEDGSSGAMPVPDFVGMTYRSARARLSDLNLQWLVIADPGVKDTLDATVYQQTPSAGTGKQVIPGSIIDLRVTADPAKVKKDTTGGKNP